MEHQETDNRETKKEKELCMNAKIQRNKHARKNWKNKLKRRKLEQKGHMAENVEEKVHMVLNADEVANLNKDLISTIKIRREKVEYNREEKEKLKIVKLGKDVFKACRIDEDLRVKWRSMKAAGEVD
ncbi:hypothetical protein MKW92_014533 [Papaver armeniacum]|nr:hypothetical protein MKW92_014533 [Papaver armeniacum]